MIIFISSKFIVPRDKYINENPKSNNPDAKDPKTKYFIPASLQNSEFLLNFAKT
jgi:hypothetical protein